MKKDSKKLAEKRVSKSEKRRLEVQKEGQPTQSIKDSNAAHEGAKYRVTFLTGQFFRGQYHEQGDSIELPENDAKAYSKRTTLKIERIEK